MGAGLGARPGLGNAGGLGARPGGMGAGLGLKAIRPALGGGGFQQFTGLPPNF
jgi:hypothetical protein